MAMTFEGNPPVEQILQGATAVALGRLVEVVAREEDSESKRLLLTHRVEVDEVLAGDLDREILLREVDSGDRRDSDGQRLLVLTPDSGAGRDNQYVAYFTPPSAVEDGRCAIGDEDSVGVEEIRERLASLAKQRKGLARSLAKEELGQDLEAPYPEVTEVSSGRGDAVTDAQLAEPLGRRDRDEKQAN